MADGSADAAPPKLSLPVGFGVSRISQACLACRRKKVKCDGQSPCHNCSSRCLTCEYPKTSDNASSSRQYASSLEERCQQLDQFCGRLESLSIELTESILEIKHLRHAPPDLGLAVDDELQQAAHALQSLPTVYSGSIPTMNELSIEVNATPDAGHELISEHAPDNISDTNNDQDISDESIDDGDFGLSKDNGEIKGMPSKFGSLVTDSYGKLRYLGGATNNVLVEAVKGLSPGSFTSIYNSSPGSSNLGQASFNHTENAPPEFEIPLFVRGQKWQELPYLPRAEDVPRPPKYVADLLVNLYFDQLHYTFPVLYKPHFMSCYRQMSPSPSGSNDNVDAKFLSVFFAVCACASTLIPLDGKSTSFPGLDYYQKSLILYYASTGEASVERVQCVALLAMCAGGWNTLTQSWTFAGQAVRAAQDLGMHLSSLTAVSTEPSDLIKQQLSRRIWWSVYCLDRVTSICLGRPMAADDSDCHCDLPLDKKDEELEVYFQNAEPSVESPTMTTSSPMTGFVAFIQLCHIGGKIQKLHSPSRIRELQDAKKARKFLRSVVSLQRALDRWLAGLPDDVRFSANATERGPNLTMCVIMFIVHAGSLLNLYRSLSGSAAQATLGSHGDEAMSHCVSAARSCINAAELVRELVPPSHHLAFCVHYLTLSGLILIPEHPREKAHADVEKCIRFLKGLESTCSGASKGRAIIEHLLKDSSALNLDGSLADLLNDPNTSWNQLPGSELFSYSSFSPDFLNL
ncbi:unnamed protein product [Clonostachys chloroleuca]|uniref:Zn(2)-C6 fungal-type domain-containing protein n=1 Tax=Clonostachys chloroleuca TaxID=1926264 RepID=A0AA35PTA7_9HYPO|nr:unnamed protein product [Clonostachys chloroleuca]